MSAGPLKRGVAYVLVQTGMLSLHRRRFERARAVILVYHRVNDEANLFFPALDVRHFLEQVEYLARHYEVAPLESTLQWLAEGAPGRARAVLTFDDGYPDTHDIVLPALQRLGLPATLFLCTGPPETGRLVWSDQTRCAIQEATAEVLHLPDLDLPVFTLRDAPSRVRAMERVVSRMKRLPPARIAAVLARIESQLLPRPSSRGLLDWERVRAIARGPFTLGAHTHNHFLLANLSLEEIAHEIGTSVDLIERHVGVRVRSFAYPNGMAEDYDDRSRGILAGLGIRYAVTCRHGFARVQTDPYQVARVYTTERYLPLFATRIAGLTREPSQEVA